MRLIVTRPVEDAAHLVEKLKERGHEAISAPMISIEFFAGAEIPDLPWQAILVTSANSIRALVSLNAHEKLLNTRVLAVGPASTAAARSAGFQKVSNAEGDLPALTALAKDQLDPGAGPILYPSGTRISGDLKGQLESEGFTCERIPLYDAVTASVVPAHVADTIRRTEVDGVLLYSPRTARTWASCVAASALSRELQGTPHWCLSAAVAEALAEDWPGTTPPVTRISPQPNETSIIEAICAGPDT